MTEEEEDCYDMTAFIDPVEQDVFIFKLEDCALKALISVRACVYYTCTFKCTVYVDRR